MAVTKEAHGLLTDAEADLVNRRVDNGMTVNEAVASVKAERVGPAALSPDSPSANEPGGHIAPPSVNGPEATLQRLYQERDRLNAEIATVESDVESRRRAYPAEPTPAPEPEPEAQHADGLGGESSDADLAAASAADLVAFVQANPDRADRVLEIELGRDTPRKTVVDAAGGDR